ncbi:homocysteine S-methyltransferase family protein [Faunimonas sp. B44]|uniref:homocysteine S-methyltransferase family protein n=1 Tax=Faunimonas sp. B44 TaxID=3461493 RepID=UPI004043FBFB
MSKYRNRLPQLAGDLFLTDGGIETTLIFHDGFDLPHFAAFDLLNSREGVAALRAYYERYASIAQAHRLGFILESPTWRASPDWAARLGYDDAALEAANRRSIALMAELRGVHETDAAPIVISGCVGPRGDGYDPGRMMTADEAEDYHSAQVRTFAATDADMVTAITMTYPAEGAGIARAAKAAGLPVAISFTVETDGRLPTGATIADAIETVDAETGAAPAYYMLNCAHPEHFRDVLAGGEGWAARLRGIRANASRRSHAELDQAPDLDDGDPEELGRDYAALRAILPNLTILGGCCGTDHRHVTRIAAACNHGRGAKAAA